MWFMHMLQAIYTYVATIEFHAKKNPFSLSRIERIVEINLQRRHMQKRVLRILADPVHIHTIR